MASGGPVGCPAAALERGALTEAQVGKPFRDLFNA